LEDFFEYILKCAATSDYGTRDGKNLSQGTLPRHQTDPCCGPIIPRIFFPMTTPSRPVETNTQLEREVAQLMVSALNLEVAPESIQADSELYGDGLGLDSIDILEIALVASKQYGIQMKTEGEDNFAIFKSLRSLSTYIAEKRTK